MSISIKKAIEKIFSPAYNKKGLFTFFNTIETEINAQLLRYSMQSVDSFVENPKTIDDNTDSDDEIDDFN